MSKIKKYLYKTAKKAGFIFWQNEENSPGHRHIDWASEYNKELNIFANLIIKKSIKLLSNKAIKNNNLKKKKIKKMIKQKLKKSFHN